MADRRGLDRLIGAIEIWGAIYGLYFTVLALDAGQVSTVSGAGVVLLSTLFYGTSLAAGVWFLRGRDAGRRLSILVQVPQLLQISIEGLSIAIWSGGRIAVGISRWTLQLLGDFGSRFRIVAGDGARGTYVDLNLLAIGALIYLVAGTPRPTSVRSAPRQF